MTKTNTDEDVNAISAMMDGEHEAQVRLLDAFENAVRRGMDESVIDGMLQQFIDHTNVHFLSEQLLMRLHAYKAYEAHLEEHEKLLGEVRQLQESFNSGNTTNLPRLVEALREWLTVHIYTTDRVLGEYLSQQYAALHKREEA